MEFRKEKDSYKKFPSFAYLLNFLKNMLMSRIPEVENKFVTRNGSGYKKLKTIIKSSVTAFIAIFIQNQSA